MPALAYDKLDDVGKTDPIERGLRRGAGRLGRERLNVGKTDPIERGLRLGEKCCSEQLRRWKNRPDRKGIKTSAGSAMLIAAMLEKQTR